MKKSTNRIITIVFIAFSLCLFNGCSSKGKNKVSEDEHVTEIYNRAKNSLNAGNFKTAIEIFEQLDALFPFSKYSIQSQLDLIYAYYRFDEIDSAISLADNFIRFNPTHPKLSYILYMKGVIQQHDRKGLLHKWTKPKREDYETSSLKDAYESFNQLIEQFPDSKYSADARQRMIYMRNMIAENEWQIADFYLGRYQYVAAANRAKQVVQNFPQTPASRKALVTMQEAYKSLSMNDLAANMQRIIDINK